MQRGPTPADPLERGGRAAVALATLCGGMVALSRFHFEPSLPPDAWFSEAHALGLGVEFELQALERALHALSSLPPAWSVALNLSATTMTSSALFDVLAPWPTARISLN